MQPGRSSPAPLASTNAPPRLSQYFESGFRRLFAGLASSPSPAAAEIIQAVPQSLLRAEIGALPAHQLLVASGQFSVHYGYASQMPWCLQEIGRLRELTFRAAGEGTGKPSDIDLFDSWYLHLFVWDKGADAIVGAYRLGLADQILARHGRRGLYTHSLFQYGSRMLAAIHPAIELGRSFVRVEYQRSYSPLMLLWRGIGEFVVRSPRYAVMFGAVSISNDYAPASRHLMVEYLKINNAEARLARHVRPRKPFRSRAPVLPQGMELADLSDIEELSRLVRQIERDSKGVPILIKQYLKLGGRILGFSADSKFNDALDGLIMVDLRASDPRVLARYLGDEGAASFLAHHETLPLRQAS